METFLIAFLLTISLSIALNIIFKKFNIPTIIGYIVTGVVIADFFYYKANQELDHIAEFGIVFLMFTIGLEFSFKHLMSMKKEVFFNGGIQVLASGFFLAIMVGYALNLKDEVALIVGLALALSSTAIVLKTLNDSGDITKIYGRKALGILLFQDIAVIPILLMIDIFSSADASVSSLLLKTIGGAVLLIVLLFLLGKYVINFVFYKVIQTNSDEIFIATILFLVIGSSTLSHIFGFSYSLGAFLAGMLMAETEYKHRIEADLIPFRDLLLGLFFISVGMQINTTLIYENLFIIVSLLIGAMSIKILVIFMLLITYLSRRVSIKTALSLCQIGEFALAVFALLGSRGLLDAKTAQILIAVSVISMFITPFILKNLYAIANLVQKEEPLVAFSEIKPQKIKNHIVVFGYGTLGQEVVLRLKEKKLPYLVLESDINLVELGLSRGENVFLGNVLHKSTYENSCIDVASAVIITVSNEQKLELITQNLAQRNPNIQTIVKLNSYKEKELFENLNKNFHLVEEDQAMAKILVHEALLCKIGKAL
ncbi:potassium transporter [Campylobacter mucosalis]|uniref:cation:proton antiporter n=1 Tax=Campylobacter mucosalis TaxID=202 RepID=UPI0004D659AA|nr:cation:proton antiporter [Campylobacter mucosalis]KEA46685.1 potassium transporter [Campylobacter mucosalis]QKF62789.1 glutathione-regulated potassium-efflux system protein, KefB/KefC family [Campylobacter mucosalis]